MSSGIESTSSAKAATSAIASKPKVTTLTDQHSFAKAKQSLPSSIVHAHQQAFNQIGNSISEAAEQVGGFFTGIGEVAYETGEGLASLGSSIAKTAYDLSPIEPCD